MTPEQVALDLNGPTMLPHDYARVGKQRAVVLAYMADGAWRTLREIAECTGYGEASISARLRDYRKAKYGGHAVDRRRRGPGTHEYRLTLRGDGR